MRYERCRQLFGDDFDRLRQAHILLLGVGGVGSFALDCLYRSGIGQITIVDHDTYDESNRNRQLGSDEAVDQSKTATLAHRYPGIHTIEERIDLPWVETFDFTPYDLVLDAIDSRHVKVALARRLYPKLIMSVGSAGRIDPTRIRAVSIWKSQGDPLARKIRNELKKARFDRNFTVITSDENVRGERGGSFVGVTGSFGLTLCAEAVKKLLAR